jgi:hypothetical protein
MHVSICELAAAAAGVDKWQRWLQPCKMVRVLPARSIVAAAAERCLKAILAVCILK